MAVVPIRRAPKVARTQMDTLILDIATINQWRLPGFQRPLKVNDKVRTISDELKTQTGGVLPGVITLGTVEGDPVTYLLDGQHRLEAFRMSEMPECIADVRICHYETFGDMGSAFVDLNSAIVRMRPDDVLRGLEGRIEALQMIRRGCPFVGYDMIRRNEKNPIISMSGLLRCWHGSLNETPTTGTSAVVLAQDMTAESAKRLVDFLDVAVAAWGRDTEYSRLWLALNLTLSMWMWRKLVIDTERGVKRFLVLKPSQFKKCLMGLSASPDYLDWLSGRGLTERDRSPCYQRLKAIFARRLIEDGIARPLFPQVPWNSP